MGQPLSEAYNLLEEKWIPVLYRDGKTDRVGIYRALSDAGKIRQLAASNPMDRVALLRFLLAVLMWCKEDAKSALAALDEKSVGIPESWLDKLKENKDSFNLLGDGKRFYQDELLKGKESRPISDLLVEFPGADSVNHMRHIVHDGSYGFCPACCAMGILRLSVWAPANRFYPASVNPGSAAYAFIEGENFYQILFANLPETNPQADQAPWLGSEQPNPPDAVAKLAWRPRKLWLNVEESGGPCACCEQIGTLVKTLSIEKGWATPITESQQFGKDVLCEFQKLNAEYKSKQTDRRKLANKVVKIAPVILKCRMSALSQAESDAAQAPENESHAAKIARVFEHLYVANKEKKNKEKIIKKLIGKPTVDEQSLLDRQDTQAKKFWVEDPHLLKGAEAIRLPDLSKDVAMHNSKFWRDALRLHYGKVIAIGIVGDGQYNYHDAPAVRLPDASDDVKGRAKLTADCGGELRGLFKHRKVTQNPQRQHPEIGSALKLLTPNAETQIRNRLNRLNTETGDNATEEKAFLREIYAPVVEQVIATVTPGSPLRRRDVRNHAKFLLNKKIKELVEKTDDLSNADTTAAAPDEPKHERKKGGVK